jgi:hypothetical protein
LTAAAAALPKEEQVQSLRSATLLRLGRWKDAYEMTGREQEDFLRIAYALFQKEDAAALEQFCDHRKATAPDDPESEYYRGWAHWLRKDYPAANRTWEAYLAGGPGRVIPSAEFDRPFRVWFRANRLADARAFVEHTPKAADRADALRWRATVAAKDGKPQEALKALEELKADVPPAGWYADRDLGPLLKAPAMAPVREKYPPPAGV